MTKDIHNIMKNMIGIIKEEVESNGYIAERYLEYCLKVTNSERECYINIAVEDSKITSIVCRQSLDDPISSWLEIPFNADHTISVLNEVEQLIGKPKNISTIINKVADYFDSSKNQALYKFQADDNDKLFVKHLVLNKAVVVYLNKKESGWTYNIENMVYNKHCIELNMDCDSDELLEHIIFAIELLITI